MGRSLTIGCQGRSYAFRRNILHRVPGARYRWVPDLYRLPRLINDLTHQRLWRKTDLKTLFVDFDLNRVDLLHLFNSVSTGRRPWVVTFEALVPRTHESSTRFFGPSPDLAGLAGSDRMRRGMEALAGSACKRLIALSASTARMQRKLLESFPETRDAIEAKLIHLHPPQAPLIEDYGEKALTADGPIRFLLVGAALARKGGPEAVAAFSDVRRRLGCDIRLTLVGRLQPGDYASRSDAGRLEETRAAIEANRDWIDHHERLPNPQVIELARRSHVGLLPTYADSYGYSVLELQAAGCPVVSTDGQALGEINAAETGWLIPVPQNRLREPLYSTPAERRELSDRIRSGLAVAVTEIVENRDLVETKGRAALARIRRDHSPEAYGAKLGEIYAEALAG